MLSIGFVCLICCFTSTVNSKGRVGSALYLRTTQFLGKPPGGSSPELSVHSFANNGQLALLESVEEEIILERNVPDARVDLGATCIHIYYTNRIHY